jgi:hypothetical protein
MKLMNQIIYISIEQISYIKKNSVVCTQPYTRLYVKREFNYYINYLHYVFFYTVMSDRN